MINSFRNFAKTKFAGLLVFIMIIPFVFWGMGGMFSSGNINSLAKINKTNISTQEFVDYLQNSNIPQETIRKNLDNNIIEELLSGLISTTLLNLEIKDYHFILSEKTLLRKIKENKNFHDKTGNFQRTKYEKFLLENNQSAPEFEKRLKNRELQKNLFSYIGAGTISPKFLIKNSYEEENQKLEIDFINLKNFYTKKENISDQDLKKFINDNKDQLKIEYIDFDYVILNPKNLIGIDEFNQTFFDKIDQIEIDISNDVKFNTIVSKLNVEPINVSNFNFSSDKKELEKKIFELRKNRFDIFEDGNNFILYHISKIEQKEPNLTDIIIKKEVAQLVYEKKKFDYNRKLLEKIKNKEFNDSDFLEMGKDKIETVKLNSIKDNKKFEINAVEIMYSLPINSFTLVNDENNNIYLAKIKNLLKVKLDIKSPKFSKYAEVHNSNNRNTLLKSYDSFLNDKYDVVLNKKTIDRVKNFFQ